METQSQHGGHLGLWPFSAEHRLLATCQVTGGQEKEICSHKESHSDSQSTVSQRRQCVSSVVQITTEGGYHRPPLDVHPVDHLRRLPVFPRITPQLGHRTGLHQKNTGKGFLMKLGSQGRSLHEEGHSTVRKATSVEGRPQYCEEGHLTVRKVRKATLF